MEDKIEVPFLTKDNYKEIVKKHIDIHVCVNMKDQTIACLEFEGITKLRYKSMFWNAFIDWKAGLEDHSYVANVNIDFNSLSGQITLSPA